MMSLGNRTDFEARRRSRRATVGPSTMPASTSPITRGWPSRTDSIPNSRATSITTAIAMKKAANRLPASRCFSAVSWASPTVSVIVRSAALPSISSVDPSAQSASPRDLSVVVLDRAQLGVAAGELVLGPEPSISILAPRQAERGLMRYSPAIESGARGRGPGGGGSRVSAAWKSRPPIVPSTARSVASASSSALLALDAAYVPGEVPALVAERPAERAVGVLDVHELARLPEVERLAEARVRALEVVAARDRLSGERSCPAENTMVDTTATATAITT